MNAPTHLFFDFDGTLLDTQADVCADMRATLLALGLEPDRFFAEFRIGPPLHQVLRDIYPELAAGAAERFIEEFRVRYDSSDYPTTRPYPGIESLLTEAAAEGKKLYIATNKRYAPTERLLRKFGWTSLFTDVFAVDKFPGSPMAKVEMLRRGGVPTASAVMIGDAATDVFAGKAAGFHTVAVTWGYDSAEQLAAAAPDHLVSTAEELARLLGVGE